MDEKIKLKLTEQQICDLMKACQHIEDEYISAMAKPGVTEEGREAARCQAGKYIDLYYGLKVQLEKGRRNILRKEAQK